MGDAKKSIWLATTGVAHAKENNLYCLSLEILIKNSRRIFYV
jgi:hypothetical protein